MGHAEAVKERKPSDREVFLKMLRGSGVPNHSGFCLRGAQHVVVVQPEQGGKLQGVARVEVVFAFTTHGKLSSVVANFV